MAATASTMLELGTAAPDFALPEPAKGNTIVSLDDFAGSRAYLIMFICNHCPYVIHVADELAGLGMAYQAKGVAVIGICSNNVETHPGDSPEKMIEQVKTRRYTFPYLYDESQDVAKAYWAACTPDFFVFDADKRLAYRGQLDDARPGNDQPVTGRDLRAALNAVIAGEPAMERQLPSMGCNIKWKPGNEPAYAQ